MRRFLATVGLAAAFLGLAGWSATALSGPPQKSRTAPQKHALNASARHQATDQSPPHLLARDIYHLLDTRITVQFPPGTTVEDALNLLRSKTRCPVIINATAFAEDPDSKDAFPEGIAAQSVRLPKLTDMRTAEVLRLLLHPVNATFLVRDGTVFIVPKNYVTSGKVLCQPVTVVFDKMPLAFALENLAERTGATIVVDSRLGANATVPVTATLSDVPVETAARLLANMSDLRLMRVGSALYVTNTDNARSFRVELDQRQTTAAKTETARRSIVNPPARPISPRNSARAR